MAEIRLFLVWPPNTDRPIFTINAQIWKAPETALVLSSFEGDAGGDN